MSSNGAIQNLAHEGFSEVIFASGKTLSITEAFEVPAGKQMTITGAAGTLALGDNMALSGTLNLPIANTTLSGGTVTLNGGTLQVDEDINFISDLAQQADSNIVVANGKNLNYTGNVFNVGAQMLTLSGAGVFANTNYLTLNDPASSLKLNGISKVANVSISAALTSGKLEIAQNSTIENLAHSGSSRLDINNAKFLTVSNAFEIPQGKSMELLGSGEGTLSLNNKLTLSGTLKVNASNDILEGGTLSLNGGTLEISKDAGISSTVLNDASSELIISSGKSLTFSGGNLNVGSHTLSIGGAGTFSNATGSPLVLDVADSILDLSGSGTVSGAVKLENGTFRVSSGTPTISGALTQSADVTIDVTTGQTLLYSGTAISLGANTLTLSGGGTFSNTNALVLNDEDSLLSLAGILTIGDVEGTAAANADKGIQVTSSATLGTFDLSVESNLAIAADKTLAGQVRLQSNGELNISGDGGYTGGIELAGGKFRAVDDQNLAGTLSLSASSEIIVPTGSTMVLNQTGGLSLGATTLTLSGGGNFQSVGLDLNDEDSKLLLNSITVDSVSTSADSSGLDIDADSTVSSLSVANITPIAIADGSILSGAITVTAGSI
jgi:hypothetical protein